MRITKDKIKSKTQKLKQKQKQKQQQKQKQKKNKNKTTKQNNKKQNKSKRKTKQTNKQTLIYIFTNILKTSKTTRRMSFSFVLFFVKTSNIFTQEQNYINPNLIWNRYSRSGSIHLILTNMTFIHSLLLTHPKVLHRGSLPLNKSCLTSL